MDTNGTHTGVVKWYNEERGFGFIIDDDPACDEAFFHISSWRERFTPATREVEEIGIRVAFELRPSKRRRNALEATNVHRVDEPQHAA